MRGANRCGACEPGLAWLAWTPRIPRSGYRSSTPCAAGVCSLVLVARNHVLDASGVGYTYNTSQFLAPASPAARGRMKYRNMVKCVGRVFPLGLDLEYRAFPVICVGSPNIWGPAAIVIAALISGFFLLADDDSPPPRPATADPTLAATAKTPARVLLAFDLSASMNCPLELRKGEVCGKALIARERRRPAEQRRRTRIEAATIFATGGVDVLNQPEDELGISTFTTSTDGGRHAARARLEPILEIGKVKNDVQSIKRAVDNLRPTSGGTPLYDMISHGVDDLRTSSVPNGVVSSLVILTDGQDTASSTRFDDLRDKLDAGDTTKPVRILITAAGEATCDQLLPLVKAFDGDCITAPTRTALECASETITDQLRTAQPRKPRSVEETRLQRAC